MNPPKGAVFPREMTPKELKLRDELLNVLHRMEYQDALVMMFNEIASAALHMNTPLHVLHQMLEATFLGHAVIHMATKEGAA